MFKFFTIIALFLSSLLTAATPANTSKINWTTDYQEALVKAKNERKPVLLFFTGSDWCGFCHKLENEVLGTTEFADKLGDKFIFVMIDFPQKTAIPPQVASQNKELQKKYNIRGFPTIILIDESEQKMGVTGYQAGGAKPYIEHLLKITTDFKGYKQKVAQLGKGSDEENLVALFEKAKELSRPEDIDKIISLGVSKKDNRFFLLERYRILSEGQSIHDLEAKEIREELLSKDPQNKEGTALEIALIDFESLAREAQDNEESVDTLVSPLTNYIQTYQESDKENIWRLEMIIAESYLQKSNKQEALKHARASSKLAPEDAQGDILAFIRNIN